MSTSHLDATSKLLKDIQSLEMELGYLPRRWQNHWDSLEAPPANPPPPPPHAANRAPAAQVTTPSMYSRQFGRSVHKRSTIDLILRGKKGWPSAGGSGTEASGTAYTHPHRFEKFNYTTPTYCDLCSSVLWGIVRTGYRCQVKEDYNIGTGSKRFAY